MSIAVDFGNNNFKSVMFSYTHLGDGTTGIGRGVLTATIAWLIDDVGNVTAAIARTSPSENPSRERGRAHATERLIDFVNNDQSRSHFRVATASEDLTHETNIVQLPLEQFKLFLRDGRLSRQYARRRLRLRRR